MRKETTIGMIVVLVASVAVGLAGTSAIADDDGPTTSQVDNCPTVTAYAIPNAHSTSSMNPRTLLGGIEEIAAADVEADTPRELRVHLETSNDQLDIEVFHEEDGVCEEFKPADCDQSVTSTGHVLICTLDAPDEGVKMYWVHFTNPQQDQLTYHAWTPEA